VGEFPPKVLLVDDEPSLREILRFDFEELGFEVVEAANGVEALICLRAHAASITLIVSDIRMPEMDGFQMLQEIIRLYPSPPAIVMMSGFTDHGEDDILRLGVKKIYKKPLKFDRFFREVVQFAAR
jgi:CheY-like chemotaxis protein